MLFIYSVFIVITALNSTSSAESGPPMGHIPHGRTFRSAELAPFATNIQFPRMYIAFCSFNKPFLSLPLSFGVHLVTRTNDAVAPLTGIRGCPEQLDGMCPVDAFVAAQKEIIRNTDWNMIAMVLGRCYV